MALILRYAHLNPNDPAFSHRFFQVSYAEDSQDWNQPFQLFNAIFEIYNLASIIQNDRPQLERIGERIETLANDISNNFAHTFKSKRTHHDTGEGGTPSNPTKRIRPPQGGNIGLGLQCNEDVYEDRQVVDSFTRAGYTLESNDEDEKGFAPLNQVKQRSTLSVDLN